MAISPLKLTDRFIISNHTIVSLGQNNCREQAQGYLVESNQREEDTRAPC